MLKTELASNDIFLISSNAVDEICKLLRKTGILYVTYLKNFKDGSQINLSNNAAWIEHYYKFKLYKSSMFEGEPHQYKTGYVIWPKESNLEVFTHGREYFDSDNGLTVVEKSEGFSEFFFFSGSHKSTFLPNIYINNIDIIQNFIGHFKKELQDILKKAEQSRIFIPERYRQKNLEIKNIITYETKLSQIRNYLSNIGRSKADQSKFNKEILDLLSKKELEIITCLIHGKTAKETAKLLVRSHRTVERHIENIKAKLNCRNKLELASKILNSDGILA